MTFVGWLQIVIVLALVVAAAIPLSCFIKRVLDGERTCLSPALAPVERFTTQTWVALADYGVTHAVLVPTMINLLFLLPLLIFFTAFTVTVIFLE